LLTIGSFPSFIKTAMQERKNENFLIRADLRKPHSIHRTPPGKKSRGLKKAKEKKSV